MVMWRHLIDATVKLAIMTVDPVSFSGHVVVAGVAGVDAVDGLDVAFVRPLPY